jgi:hypothetical protein
LGDVVDRHGLDQLGDDVSLAALRLAEVESAYARMDRPMALVKSSSVSMSTNAPKT